MIEAPHPPTPYPEVNAVLLPLLAEVRTILAPRFVGMYLYGSLAGGDFDRDSDVDFVVVTEGELSREVVADLRDMHVRVAGIDCWCATQLEGSYIPRRALRRYDPADALHPHIDRGRGQRLEIVRHDHDWVVQRHVLRERGITLAGPPPQTLIDPVSARDLRDAMSQILRYWAAPMLDDPAPLRLRGYQSYLVLSMCRILYTLDRGEVVSKPAAARWAGEVLDQQWAPLIERALAGRSEPESPADSLDIELTLDLIRLTVERGQMRAEGAGA